MSFYFLLCFVLHCLPPVAKAGSAYGPDAQHSCPLIISERTTLASKRIWIEVIGILSVSGVIDNLLVVNSNVHICTIYIYIYFYV